MVYRFTIISDEVDDFIREIQIDSEATFFELHEAILKAAKYNDDQLTSFFTCDEDWEKEQEITLLVVIWVRYSNGQEIKPLLLEMVLKFLLPLSLLVLSD